MKRYHADECCRSGWEDARFYLCSDVDSEREAMKKTILKLKKTLIGAVHYARLQPGDEEIQAWEREIAAAGGEGGGT